LPAIATANEELERCPPPHAADPAPTAEGDPELLDPQLLGDADGPYVEMVRAQPVSASSACSALIYPSSPAQDLHCGVFEKVPATADAYSGSESDDESDGADSLALPSAQTAAMAKARAAGKTLIAEVGSGDGEGQPTGDVEMSQPAESVHGGGKTCLQPPTQREYLP